MCLFFLFNLCVIFKLKYIDVYKNIEIWIYRLQRLLLFIDFRVYQRRCHCESYTHERAYTHIYTSIYIYISRSNANIMHMRDETMIIIHYIAIYVCRKFHSCLSRENRTIRNNLVYINLYVCIEHNVNINQLVYNVYLANWCVRRKIIDQEWARKKSKQMKAVAEVCRKCETEGNCPIKMPCRVHAKTKKTFSFHYSSYSLTGAGRCYTRRLSDHFPAWLQKRPK